MYNHNKAQQSKNRVHISWDILYHVSFLSPGQQKPMMPKGNRKNISFIDKAPDDWQLNYFIDM